MALDYEENLIPDESDKRESGTTTTTSDEEDDDDPNDLNEDDLIETKSVIVKADTAGSLTSIQDTVDQMAGISVRGGRLLLHVTGGGVAR